MSNIDKILIAMAIAILITCIVVITREITLENVCESRGGILLKGQCIKVEVIK